MTRYFHEKAGPCQAIFSWSCYSYSRLVEQADAYAKAVAAGLEAVIPAGMTKLCRTIEDGARFDKPSISGG